MPIFATPGTRHFSAAPVAQAFSLCAQHHFRIQPHFSAQPAGAPPVAQAFSLCTQHHSGTISTTATAHQASPGSLPITPAAATVHL
jgi:hypothetical protein